MSWKRHKLIEICTKVTDGTHDSPKSVLKGYPYVKGLLVKKGRIDFDNCEFLSEQDHLKVISRSKAEQGDVLFANIGINVGECAYVNVDFEFSIKNLALFKPKFEILNGRFLYFLLSSEYVQTEIKNKKSGSAQPFLSLETLRNHIIEIPPLETQKRIASILSTYDDLIENNLKRIKLLEETAQNIYKEWFVNFRFPNYEHTEFDKDSGLPVGWEIKKADNVYDINIGKTPPRGETQWFSLTDGIKWVSIADMNKSTVFVINTNEKITKDGVDKFNMRKASIGSVLLSFKLTVGSVAITNEEVVTNEAIAHFNLLEDSILTTEYTYQFLKNFHYPSLGSTSSIGTSINSKIVKNMDIIIPNENLIKEFSKGVKNIFIQIENLINQNQKLKEARDILLPRFMNRTIEV